MNPLIDRIIKKRERIEKLNAEKLNKADIPDEQKPQLADFLNNEAERNMLEFV